MCAMPLLTRESTHEIIALHRSAIENSNELVIGKGYTATCPNYEHAIMQN